ncbi:MAG: HAMP domain-containing sensor histidine kinase [Bacteroidota bacterium]
MKFVREHILAILSIAFLGLGGLLTTDDEAERVDASKLVTDITAKLEREIQLVESEMKPTLEQIKGADKVNFSTLNKNLKYPFFLYKNERLHYWSDYRFVPEYREVRGDYQLKLIESPHGHFIARRWEVNGEEADDKLELFSFIPLSQKHKIRNKYLDAGYNLEILPAVELTIHAFPFVSENQVCINESNCLFALDFKGTLLESSQEKNRFSIALFTLSLVFFLTYMLWSVRALALKGHVIYGFALLFTGLLALRYLMVRFDFPAGMVDMPLFDSRYYASSTYNASLGDLLINAFIVFLLCFYFFINYHRSHRLVAFLVSNNPTKYILPVILIGLGLTGLLYFFLFFKTIYHNSQIVLDITSSIRFDHLRIVTFTIFLLNSISIFLLFHVIARVVYKTCDGAYVRMAILFLITAVIFTIISIIERQDFVFVLVLALLYFFVLYTLKLSHYLSRFRYISFIYLFLGAFSSSLMGAWSIYFLEGERVLKNKVAFANQFFIERDDFAEFLLSEAIQKIESDGFIKSRMTSMFRSKDVIEQKLRQIYLNNYFSKYDINIDIYNANGDPFKVQESSLDYNSVKAQYALPRYSTSYDGLYFVSNVDAGLSKRYLAFIEIERFGVVSGHILIDLQLKKNIPQSVYPELLIDDSFQRPYQGDNYNYAVFVNEKVIYSSGDYNYKRSFDKALLQQEKLFKEGIADEGYEHVAIADEQRIIVISSESYTFGYMLSNFSFLFMIQVFVVVIILSALSLYYFVKNRTLNYAAKIQLYLNLAFFLPLLVVSLTTLGLINSSSKRQLRGNYLRKATNVANNLSKGLNSYLTSPQAEVEDRQDDFARQLASMSEFERVDINIFDLDGHLIDTSQPLIYENDLLSNYINPEAFAYIKEQDQGRIITNESVGELNYNSTYVEMRGDADQLIGVLSIPFFEYEKRLETQQIDVLSTIMNVFTVIFIIFLIVSYFVSKWLTFPLRFITQKLRKTTLAEFNEPLNWDSADEIGLMVGEYNRMVNNLEQSKRALAKSEKESAWREMAQQVAHEIKNPLTPMKLTLQQLDRMLRDRSENGENLATKPINTLLHQIETLDGIATSFSSFAKMPIPENERFELVSLVKKTVNLHNNTVSAPIKTDIERSKVYVRGDEKLTGRILSNLIINAYQSEEENKALQIDLILSVTANRKVLIEVRDNGCGIDEEHRNKVFIPQFSTKDTGSGIGLAIAKHGIEHAGGKIWFETETGEGTSFFVELPLVD